MGIIQACLLEKMAIRDLKRIAAFECDVDETQVTITPRVTTMGQGIYHVTVPGITRPIRYDRMGTVLTRNDSAPPSLHKRSNAIAPTED